MSEEQPNYDPYANCEETCYHDCGQGALVTDILSGIDGPHDDAVDKHMNPQDHLSPVARTVMSHAHTI